MARGEGTRVEFKSSLRYDVNKGEKNAVLETVVAKTVAGFMNAEGVAAGDPAIQADARTSVVDARHGPSARRVPAASPAHRA